MYKTLCSVFIKVEKKWTKVKHANYFLQFLMEIMKILLLNPHFSMSRYILHIWVLYIFWKLWDQGTLWWSDIYVMGWNKAARIFVFAPDSNWTLIWHLLLCVQCQCTYDHLQMRWADTSGQSPSRLLLASLCWSVILVRVLEGNVFEIILVATFWDLSVYTGGRTM